MHIPVIGFLNNLYPRGDDLPVQTWRRNEDVYVLRRNHKYPQKGVQGEPLPEQTSPKKRTLTP